MKTEYSFDNETWYDAPDGKSFVPGIGEIHLRMTNETTASQSKSIGDDAIEEAALKHVATNWAMLPVAAYRSGDYKQTEQFKRLKAFALELLDSRAPAAQAAATIQAAPEELFAAHYYDPLHLVKHLHANIGWSGAVGNFIPVDDDLRQRFLACIKRADAATIQAAPSDLAGWFAYEEGAWVATSSDWPGATKLYRAATIQEPVMVAEPVGEAQISAAGWRYRVRKYGGEWTATASKLLIDRMKVVDPEFWEIESLFTQSIINSVAQTSAAADYIDAKAEKYLEENADIEPETGATVFHYGEAGRDYHSSLVELAEEIRAIRPSGGYTCNVPPLGWHCTRTPGHEGACAAWPGAAPMVAEPVGEGQAQTSAAFPLMRAAFETSESGPDGYFIKFKFPTLVAMQKAHIEWIAAQLADSTTLAAPLVADPAGVAVPKPWNERIGVKVGELISPYAAFDPMKAEILEWRTLAATVKAVPSEAMDWRETCEALIEIWDDGLNNPPERRHYAEGAWPAFIEEIRVNLAAPLADKTGGGE